MSNLVARIGVQPFVLVENLVILCKHFIDQIRIDSPTVNVEEKSARKSNDFLVLETGIGCGFLSTKTLLLFTTYLFANRCRRVSTKHAGERAGLFLRDFYNMAFVSKYFTCKIFIRTPLTLSIQMIPLHDPSINVSDHSSCGGCRCWCWW